MNASRTEFCPTCGADRSTILCARCHQWKHFTLFPISAAPEFAKKRYGRSCYCQECEDILKDERRKP
jgi:hypothetical protein